MSWKEGKSDESTWKYINYEDVELGEMIGGGGVGVIYKGHYNRQDIAIKTFFDPRRVDEKVKQDFIDELLVMSKLKHSNIVNLIGACTDHHLFFVMELCESSLFNLLHVDKTRFSDKENLQICIDIGCAMEYLHSLTPVVIHRDLKSHNILRSFDGVYKLCDFGQVKVKNTAAGTPIYMAPELFLNKSYNKSVDAYSFGILLWEIFNQEVPFYMIEIADIRERVINGERPRLNSYSIPTVIVKLIKACWSQDSSERPLFSDIVDQLLDFNTSIQEGKFVDKVKSSGDALDNLLK